jgi:pimeloyl-ACP methyl ester carboxylesterase
VRASQATAGPSAVALDDLDVPGLRHGWANVGAVNLHYVESGRGPLVVLLHGFPEFWYTWRHQLPALAAAGYHVVAPDLRGYGASDRPRGVDAYQIERLTADVAGLIRHFGAESAALVGHDWGGLIAWWMAQEHPQLLERLVVINAPHPVTYLRGVRRLDQARRSWYVLYFQLPWLPELSLRAADFAALRWRLRRDPCRPGAYTERDVERTVRPLAQPGALTAAVNYYRAAVRPASFRRLREVAAVELPVLVIWGDGDRHLTQDSLQGLERWAPGARIVHLPRVSHWVQNDDPRRVSELLIAFLAGDAGTIGR